MIATDGRVTNGMPVRTERIVKLSLNSIIDNDLMKLYESYLSVPDLSFEKDGSDGRALPHMDLNAYVSEIVESHVASHRLRTLPPFQPTDKAPRGRHPWKKGEKPCAS